jgi:hypothetical protein
MPEHLDQQGLSSTLCAFAVHGSRPRGKSLGGNRRRRTGPDQKKNFQRAGRTSHPWVAQSVSADDRRFVDGFQRAGVSHWKQIPRRISAWDRGSNAWTVLVDHRQQVWVGTRDEGIVSISDQSFPTRARRGNSRPADFRACLKTAADSLWAGTQNGLANFDGQKWKLFTTRDGLSENTRPRHRGRRRRKSLDRHGKPRLEFFQGRKIHFLSGAGKRTARQRHFLPLRGQGRRFVDWHFRPRIGAVSKRKMDALFHGKTALPATASVISSRTTAAICGSAPTPA